MRNQTYEVSIKQTIEKMPTDVNYVERVMQRVLELPERKNRRYFKRLFAALAIILACSTTLYAGIELITRLELYDKSHAVAGTVEIVNSKENPHAEVHLRKEAFIRYADTLAFSESWRGKSFAVIDSTLQYPDNIDMRMRTDNFRVYQEALSASELIKLPASIGDYTFQRVAITYGVKALSKKAADNLIAQHPNEKYIVTEVPTGPVKGISYEYKEGKSGFSFTIDFLYGQIEKPLLFFSELLENYEVIQINGEDVFLSQPNYIGVQYGPNTTYMLKGENYYQVNWYEVSNQASISIRPNDGEHVKEKIENIDGKKVKTTVFPKQTKEELLDFLSKVKTIIDGSMEK